jgi:formate--tetrahydrofolate ligase
MTIAAECQRQEAPCAVVEAFAKGGEGTIELAEKVVDLIEAGAAPEVRPHYSLEDSLEEKVRKVATRVYGAEGVTFGEKASAKFAQYISGVSRACRCVSRRRNIRSPTIPR